MFTMQDLKEWIGQAVRDPNGVTRQTSGDVPSEHRSLRPGERRVGRQVVDTRGSESFRRSAAAARHTGKPGWLQGVEKDFDDLSKRLGF